VLDEVLAVAVRHGDRSVQLRCLVYLCCTKLRRRDLPAVVTMAPEAEELARSLGFPEYIGMAKAMLSWAAWKQGRFAETERVAEEALAQWRTCVVRYAFYWPALWPLVGVYLSDGRYGEALSAARQLVQPDQLRLPKELEFTIEAALAAWDAGQQARAASLLASALQLAEQHSFA
jgi:hypothetical protein